jgi:hypothetical protein
MEECCEKILKRVAGNIALHLTEPNIAALIECDRGLMREVTSHPHMGGTAHHEYYCEGKSSVNQIKILHRMGAIIEDYKHPKHVQYKGMGGDNISYYKLSDLGAMILKQVAPWYKGLKKKA